MKTIRILFCLIISTSSTHLLAQEPMLNRPLPTLEDDETALFIQLFHQTLNEVVNDYPNKFKNIITGPVSEEKSDQFMVSAELPGAESVTVSSRLSRDFSSVQYTYTAKYFEGDEETARLVFENLEYLIMICPFACCKEIGYAKSDTSEGSEDATTIWMSIDEDNPVYNDMEVSLRLYKIAGSTGNWTVVFNVWPEW